MSRGKVYSLEVDSNEQLLGRKLNLKYLILVLLVTALLVTLGGFFVQSHIQLEKLEGLVRTMDRRLGVLEKSWREMRMKTSEVGKSEKIQENFHESYEVSESRKEAELKNGLTKSNILKRLDHLTQEVNSLGTPGPYPRITRPCGGFVNISEHQEQELVYEIPFPTYVSTCAWVLWTPNQSQIIQIELVNNTSLDFLPEFSLSVVENPEWDDDCCVTDLANKSDGGMATIKNFAILFFHGVSTRPGQGFQLILYAEPPDQKNHILDTTRPSETIQPDLMSVYGNTYVQVPLPKPLNGAHLRPTFIIGHAAPGTRINITVTDLELRWRHEWLTIFWFDNHRKIPTRTQNSAKGYVPRSNFSVNLKENQPFFLYFTANSKSGARVSRCSLNVTYDSEIP